MGRSQKRLEGVIRTSNQIDILKTSTDLQSKLVRDLSIQSSVSDMMAELLKRTAEVLNASACTVFTIDPGGKSATQLAGTGYQKQFNGMRDIPVVQANQVPEEPAEGEKLGLTGWILSTGKPFLARTPDEVTRHPHHSGKRDILQISGRPLRLQTFLGVPLRGLHGEVIGVIKAERLSLDPHQETAERIEPFSVGDQLALETIGRVASRCIAYLDMAKRNQEEEAITAWAQDVIAEAVATEGELDSFLDIVVKVTASAMRADSCGIFLNDESGNTLTQRAGIGSQELRQVIRAYTLPESDKIKECEGIQTCKPPDCPNKPDRNDTPGKPDSRRIGLTAWIAATGKSFHARDFNALSAHCHHRGGFDRWNFPKEKQTICGAFLGVPLKVGGTIIGVVKVENISQIGVPDQRDFSEEAQRRFEILAQDIALAIMRLQAQIPARYRVIRHAQTTVLEILRGGLDIPDMAQKVVTETRKLFNAGACALFLKEGRRLIQPPWAASGWVESGPKVREYELVEEEEIEQDPLPEEKVGLTVWIAVKQEKFTARSNLELTMHPHHKGTFDIFNFKESEQCESFMGFPLLIKEDNENRLVGVLKVETKKRKVNGTEEVTYFNELDELVFELIANSAAIAIQNARLLESRRLTERVLAQPNANEVIRILYDFLQGREEVMSTLDHTAKIVRRENLSRAEIVQGFAGLLEPAFNEAILGQLAKQMDTPVSSLLDFLAKAIRVEDLVEICRLLEQSGSYDQFPVATLLQPGYFLREVAETFLEALSDIGQRLKRFEKDRTKRTILKRSMELLQEAKKETLEGMSLFERSVLGRVFTHWHQVICEEYEKFQEIPNPYIVGPPVKSAKMFRGREDVFKFIADNLSGTVQDRTLVLHGQRRTGKTSILYQLLGGRLGSDFVPVLIDMQELALIKSTDEFLGEVAYRLAAAVKKVGMIIEAPLLEESATSLTIAFGRFLDELEAGLGNKRLVVMFDEFEIIESKIADGEWDVNLLSYLRSLIQHRTQLAFIFTGAHRLEEMSHDYWSVLFNIALYRRVSFLNPEDAAQLICDPVADALDIDRQAIEEIIRLTHAHPYYIQLICWAMVNHCNDRKRNTATTDDVKEVVHAILTSGEADTHCAYIWTQAEGVERLALTGLAHTLRSDREWAKPSEIMETLAAAGAVRIQQVELKDALDRMADREVLEAAKGKPLRYRFQIEVLRLWVEKTKPIAVVVERGK